MAITTQDQLLASFISPVDIMKATGTAEAVGVLHTPFYTAGTPGAATAPSPGLAGAALTSYAGQVPFPTAVAGKNVYLARFAANQGAGIGYVNLRDRLWHNSGIVVTTTTAQTINSVAWPARDQNGTTNGLGVYVGLEVSTATTNASAVTTITMSYTNSDGTSGRTATMPSFPATAVAGTFVPFQLQAGDVGVRSIQSVTLGTSLAGGTVHLVAYANLATLGTPLANTGYQQDAWGLGMPLCFDGTVPYITYGVTATALGLLQATVTWAQG